MSYNTELDFIPCDSRGGAYRTIVNRVPDLRSILNNGVLSPRQEVGEIDGYFAVFFTTTQSEAQFTHSSVKSMDQTSPVLVVYYTRAQAERLAELFSQEALQTPGIPSAGEDAGYSELNGD